MNVITQDVFFEVLESPRDRKGLKVSDGIISFGLVQFLTGKGYRFVASILVLYKGGS